MRRVLMFVTMMACWGSLVSLNLAAEKKASPPADKKKVEAKVDKRKVESKAGGTAVGDVRAEMHRTMAELIEAQSAEKPDQAKIDRLTKKLQELRGQFRAPSASAAAPQSAGWVCPRGGPGMGFGRGAGWGGAGQGRGAGWGAGFGPGAARGPGGGRGMGRGPGGGHGFGPGAGMGRGVGPAFVDKDQDGICDNYELRRGTQQ